MKKGVFRVHVLLGIRGWLSETSVGHKGKRKRRIWVWMMVLLWCSLMSGGVASGQVFSFSIPLGQPVLTRCPFHKFAASYAAARL